MQEPSEQPTTLNNEGLLNRTIVSALLLGIGLVFFLTGRAPGWQPFALVSVLAAISLFLTVLSLRGNVVLSVFTFTVLLLAMFWKPGEPWAAVFGTVLVLLNAVKLARQDKAKLEEAEIAEAAPQKPTEDTQDYVGI